MKKAVCFVLTSLLFNTCFADSATVRDIIGNFINKYEAITDYQCRLDEWCVKGRKEEKRAINFYFRKPRMIRMDIIEGNRPFDNGSVGVFRGGNKVTGHRGGVLSPLGLTLPKHSFLATTVRGTAFDESDMQAALDTLQFYVQKGTVTCSVSGETYQLDCRTDHVKETKGVSRETLKIDKATWLPTESESYEGSRLVRKASWSGYILNAGLPEELFHIRYDLKKLKESGVNVLTD